MEYRGEGDCTEDMKGGSSSAPRRGQQQAPDVAAWAEATEWPEAMSVFQCTHALGLLRTVERIAKSPGALEGNDASSFRVKVRVIRPAPHWRLEASVFIAKLPLFPRLGYRVGGTQSPGSGNRSGFQRLFADVIAPIHLATVAEALHAQQQPHAGCTACAGAGITRSHASSGGCASQPTERRESVASEESLRNVGGTAPPLAFLAKLLVTFRLDPRGLGSDFRLAPFLSLHYTPNLGCAAVLACTNDPDVVSANRLVGDQYNEFLAHCLTGQSGHHSLEHTRIVHVNGHEVSVGVMKFRKSQVKRDLARSVLPVLGYMLWEFEDRGVIERFLFAQGLKTHTPSLTAFVKAVEGIDTPQQALAALQAVLEDGSEPSAIALLLFGHSWNPDKRWSRMTSSRILTQPWVDGGGTTSGGSPSVRGPSMCPLLSAEVSRSRTGRRPNEGFRHFEHILLSSSYEEVERCHPHWMEGLFFGARGILCKDEEHGATMDRVSQEIQPVEGTTLHGLLVGSPPPVFGDSRATPPLHEEGMMQSDGAGHLDTLYCGHYTNDGNDENADPNRFRPRVVETLLDQVHAAISATQGACTADETRDPAGFNPGEWMATAIHAAGRNTRPALHDIGNAPAVVGHGMGKHTATGRSMIPPPVRTAIVDAVGYAPVCSLHLGDLPITPTASLQYAQQAYIASPLTGLTPVGLDRRRTSLATHEDASSQDERGGGV